MMEKTLTKMQRSVIDYLRENLKVETDTYRDVRTDSTYITTEVTIKIADEIVSHSQSTVEIKENGK